jgi:hypothetical protein
MRRLTGLALGLVLLLAACGSDDGAQVRQVDGTGTVSGSGTGSGPASGSGTAFAVPCKPVGDPATADATVGVELLDRDILVDPAQAGAGTVTFEISNNGTELHQLVVVRAHDPSKLPLDDGRIALGRLPKGTLIGQVEPWSPQVTCTATLELRAGSYALFCNILETEADGTKNSHYANGMRTGFRVRR